MLYHVKTSYDAWFYPQMDDALEEAVGHASGFAGMGFGQRDHGWVCDGELEAKRVEKAIKSLALKAEIREAKEE